MTDTSTQDGISLAPLPALKQLQLTHTPAYLLQRMPPMPLLTKLHVVPLETEPCQVLMPWLESYPSLPTLRCTYHTERRPVIPAGTGSAGVLLHLPALTHAEFVVPAEVVPHLSRLTTLSSLKMCRLVARALQPFTPHCRYQPLTKVNRVPFHRHGAPCCHCNR